MGETHNQEAPRGWAATWWLKAPPANHTVGPDPHPESPHEHALPGRLLNETLPDSGNPKNVEVAEESGSGYNLCMVSQIDLGTFQPDSTGLF